MTAPSRLTRRAWERNKGASRGVSSGHRMADRPELRPQHVADQHGVVELPHVRRADTTALQSSRRSSASLPTRWDISTQAAAAPASAITLGLGLRPAGIGSALQRAKAGRPFDAGRESVELEAPHALAILQPTSLRSARPAPRLGAFSKAAPPDAGHPRRELAAARGRAPPSRWSRTATAGCCPRRRRAGSCRRRRVRSCTSDRTSSGGVAGQLQERDGRQRAPRGRPRREPTLACARSSGSRSVTAWRPDTSRSCTSGAANSVSRRLDRIDTYAAMPPTARPPVGTVSSTSDAPAVSLAAATGLPTASSSSTRHGDARKVKLERWRPGGPG